MEVVQCDLLADKGGGLQMRTFALFGAKNNSLKFKVCPHGQGEGQFFAILYGRLLWAPLMCLIETQIGVQCRDRPISFLF